MSDKVIWIVGKYKGATGATVAWDFQGVFDSEQLAESACVEREDFIGPAVLNEELPQESGLWAGCRYPIAEREA